MKTLTVLLLVALLFAGIAASVLPVLSAWSTPSQPAAPALSISDSVPPLHIACYPDPCNCGPDC
jgi:hypothetical protein